MMLIRKGKLFFECLKSGFIPCNVRFLTVPQSVEKTTAELVSKSKTKREPLMKNTFVGLFEDEFFQVPSRKNANLPIDMAEFYQTVKNNQSENYQDQLKKFAQSGFYQFNSSNANLENFAFIDLLHLYEELDLDPTLSALLEIHSSFIIPAIINYGSSEQKEKYLKKLFKGEVSGALALSEESGGSDLASIKMIAKENIDGSFIVNGGKNWVTNAMNADFFLVVAKVPIDNLKHTDGSLYANDIVAFIIDKHNSIHTEKHDSCGLYGCGIAELKIENVLIPASCALTSPNVGLSVASLGLKSPKFISLICILNHLKKFISDVSLHVNSRKQIPRDLRDNVLVQKKLSNIMEIAYSFESMLYMTANILDKYDTDTTIESGLLQIFGFEQGINALSLCMELLGAKAYDKTFPYEKILCDIKGLSLLNSTNIIRLFVSLTGLDYAGIRLQKIVKQNRNPLNFPGAVVKRIFENHKFFKDKVKLNLHLYKNLHPSLKENAEDLEYCIIRFRYIVEVIFSRYGSEVGNKLIDLNRISDIALDIFIMISVLRRSSHSYCIGVSHSDQEILLTKNICYNSHQRVKKIMDDIMRLEVTSSDSISLDIGSYLLKKQTYFIEHPLKHDI